MKQRRPARLAKLFLPRNARAGILILASVIPNHMHGIKPWQKLRAIVRGNVPALVAETAPCFGNTWEGILNATPARTISTISVTKEAMLVIDKKLMMPEMQLRNAISGSG